MAVVLAGLMALILTFGAKPAQASEAVVSEARGYIGSAYDYSGYGWGYDCSEFTSLVLSQFGVSLADNPATQYVSGTPSNGAAGDLVFYSEYGAGITHVGIATGYGTVIHSSSYYGAVVESPIYEIPGYAGAVDVY
ncbi:MAG: C40 family peptidase [Rubrobacteraceae bacterium]